jgi:hypothetical protein
LGVGSSNDYRVYGLRSASQATRWTRRCIRKLVED